MEQNENAENKSNQNSEVSVLHISVLQDAAT